MHSPAAERMQAKEAAFQKAHDAVEAAADDDENGALTLAEKLAAKAQAMKNATVAMRELDAAEGHARVESPKSKQSLSEKMALRARALKASPIRAKLAVREAEANATRFDNTKDEIEFHVDSSDNAGIQLSLKERMASTSQEAATSASRLDEQMRAVELTAEATEEEEEALDTRPPSASLKEKMQAAALASTPSSANAPQMPLKAPSPSTLKEKVIAAAAAANNSRIAEEEEPADETELVSEDLAAADFNRHSRQPALKEKLQQAAERQQAKKEPGQAVSARAKAPSTLKAKMAAAAANLSGPSVDDEEEKEDDNEFTGAPSEGPRNVLTPRAKMRAAAGDGQGTLTDENESVDNKALVESNQWVDDPVEAEELPDADAAREAAEVVKARSTLKAKMQNANNNNNNADQAEDEKAATLGMKSAISEESPAVEKEATEGNNALSTGSGAHPSGTVDLPMAAEQISPSATECASAQAIEGVGPMGVPQDAATEAAVPPEEESTAQDETLASPVETGLTVQEAAENLGLLQTILEEAATRGDGETTGIEVTQPTQQDQLRTVLQVTAVKQLRLIMAEFMREELACSFHEWSRKLRVAFQRTLEKADAQMRLSVLKHAESQAAAAALQAELELAASTGALDTEQKMNAVDKHAAVRQLRVVLMTMHKGDVAMRLRIWYMETKNAAYQATAKAVQNLAAERDHTRDDEERVRGMLKLAQERNVELEQKVASLAAEVNFGFHAASEMMSENDTLASAMKATTQVAALSQLKMILAHIYQAEVGLRFRNWNFNALACKRQSIDVLAQVHKGTVAIDSDIASLTRSVNEKIQALPEPEGFEEESLPIVNDSIAPSAPTPPEPCPMPEVTQLEAHTGPTPAAVDTVESPVPPQLSPSNSVTNELASTASNTSDSMSAPEDAAPSAPQVGRSGSGAPVMSAGAAAYLRCPVPAEPSIPVVSPPNTSPPNIDLTQLKADQVEQVAALSNAVFVNALANVSFEEQKHLRALLRSERQRLTAGLKI